MKRGRWEGGVFIVLGDVEEGDNVNVKGAAEKIDISHMFPNGAPKSLQVGAGREDSNPLGGGKVGPSSGGGINLTNANSIQ